MMLTFKEANEFNKENLTLKQVQTLYEKHGFAAVIFAGKIVEFIHSSFAGVAREFSQGVS